MSPTRHGHNTDRRLETALDALHDLRTEFELLEHEHARYRRALRQIAAENKGDPGAVARAALHPPRREED
jgi:hypothetical protein